MRRAFFRDQILVINPESGWVIERFKTAGRPYRILFHPDGKSFFVTSWAEASLHQHRTQDGEHLGMVRLGSQPMDMVWRDKPLGQLESGEKPPAWKARIFVAVANTNQVHVVGVTESKDLEVLDPIRLSLWPYQPLGMTPSALALSEDQDRLFVACSDYNAVAVLDVSGIRGRGVGFVPSGWYPIAVRALPGGRLIVLNGRGTKSSANLKVPNAAGTGSVIDPLDSAALREFTKVVFRNSPYSDKKLLTGADARYGHRDGTARAKFSTSSTSSRRTGPTTKFWVIWVKEMATRSLQISGKLRRIIIN